MRKSVLPLLILLALLPNQLWAQTTAFEEDMRILVEKIQAEKEMVVTANMELTNAEAQDFWPIYEAYQHDLKTVNQRLISAILNYAEAYKQESVTDAQATLMISEGIAIERFEVDPVRFSSEVRHPAFIQARAWLWLPISSLAHQAW